MAEKRKREYGEAELKLHREVLQAVEKETRKSDVSCVSVSSIRKQVGKDQRTVNFHLKLLEQDGGGKLSRDGKMFCPTEKK